MKKVYLNYVLIARGAFRETRCPYCHCCSGDIWPPFDDRFELRYCSHCDKRFFVDDEDVRVTIESRRPIKAEPVLSSLIHAVPAVGCVTAAKPACPMD